MTDPVPLRFVVYSRSECGLCEELLRRLAALPGAGRFPVDVVDVDSDPLIRRRYGHKVPVLLFAGDLVCHGRLDPAEVDKALAYHARPVY
jgi:predicted thioredoxin/glutaredoxin